MVHTCSNKCAKNGVSLELFLHKLSLFHKQNKGLKKGKKKVTKTKQKQAFKKINELSIRLDDFVDLLFGYGSGNTALKAYFYA